MKVVRLPNGETFNFEDDVPDAVINEFIANRVSETQPRIPMEVAPQTAGQRAQDAGALAKATAEQENQAEHAQALQTLAASYSPMEAMTIGAGRTGERWLQGGADIADSIGQFIRPDNPAYQQRRQARQEDMASADALYRPLAEEFPISTAIGEGAPYAISSGQGFAGSALIPGLLGALEYETDPINRAMRGGLTAGAGVVANAATRGLLGREVPRRLDPYERRTLLAGERLGFRTRPSTIAGGSSRMKNYEARLQSSLRTADVVDDVLKHNEKRFNSIAAQRFGEKGDRLTPELLRRSRDRLSAEFNELSKSVDVQMDDELLRKLVSIQDSYYGVPGRSNKQVQRTVNDLIGRFDKGGGKITAKEYMEYTSGFVKDGMSLVKGKDAARGHALFDMRKALDDAFDKASGNKARLLKARDQYRRFLYIKSATDTNGNVSWSKLNRTLRKNDEWGYVYDANKTPDDLYEALRYLQLYPDNFGNSGTAQRGALASQSLLDAVRTNARDGAVVGWALDPSGVTGPGLGAGGGAAVGAVKYATDPLAAKLYFSKAMNRGLLHPTALPGPLGALAGETAHDILRRSITPGLLSMEAYRNR